MQKTKQKIIKNIPIKGEIIITNPEIDPCFGVEVGTKSIFKFVL